MEIFVLLFICLQLSSCLTDEEAKQMLCSTSEDSLNGGVIVTNDVVYSTLCGVGDGDCRDVFPMTEFGVPLECSQVIQNKLCDQPNIKDGDFCAKSCGRCAQCETTLAGCKCQKDWVLQETGETFNGCQLPDDDPRGPWCIVDQSTCQGDPAGKGYDYCDRSCVETDGGVPPPAQENQQQNQEKNQQQSPPVQENLNDTEAVSKVPSPEKPQASSVDPSSAYEFSRGIDVDAVPEATAQTPAPSPTPTPTPSPTPTPTPSPAPAPAPSPSPSPSSPQGQSLDGASPQDWIQSHNEYRSKHCVGNLEWDQNLAQQAKQSVASCDSEAPPLGNQLTIFGNSVSASSVVASWYSNVANYDFSNNNPEPSTLSQVIWKNSKKVGCGVSDQCEDGSFLVQCIYDPSGNVVGQFVQNVLPETCGVASQNGNLERTQDEGTQDEGPAGPNAWINEHNIYRKLHCVEDLKWNQNLADEAKKFALTCDSNQDSAGNGKNVFIITSSAVTAQEVTQFWYNQGDGYDFSNPKFDGTAGTMTQIIWKGTQEIGCGVGETCQDGKLYVYCLYNPGGNISNQMAQNVQEKCQ